MSPIPNAKGYKDHQPEPILTEEQLWAMVEGNHHGRREEGIVLVMIRFNNGAPFTEENPFNRAYSALLDLGDAASMYVLRHFLTVAEGVMPKRNFDEAFYDLFVAPRRAPVVAAKKPKEKHQLHLVAPEPPPTEPDPPVEVVVELAPEPEAAPKRKKARTAKAAPPVEEDAERFGPADTPAFLAKSAAVVAE